MRSKIILGDCIQKMEKIPSNSVDLIITDPPFGIQFTSKKANYNRKENLVLKGYHDIPKERYRQFSLDWIRRIRRILKISGQAFIFSGYNNILDITHAIDLYDFEMVGIPVWKFNFGTYAAKKWVNSHYNILNICKNPKKITFNGDCRFTGTKERYADLEDVFYIQKEYWPNEKKVPTKLPSELCEKLISYCSNPGDVVLDPFLGGGTVAVAAKHLKRKYIGIEIVPEYYNFARERLKK